MGMLCMVLGGLVFLGSLAGGFVLANELIPLINMFKSALTSISISDGMIYVICVGGFGLIGLLFGFSLFMNGVNYIRLDKLHDKMHKHHVHTSKKADKE